MRSSVAVVWTLLALVMAVAPAMGDDPPAAPGPKAAPVVIDLWPGGTGPGDPGGIGAEADQPPAAGQRTVRRIQNVSHPTMTVYPAPREHNTGTAVIIAPGGGYNILAWDLEGVEVAGWLESLGVTSVVLKYRVPRRPGDAAGEPPLWPLQDIQRAMSLVRSRAGEWGIDPERVGVLGFSAGGNLAARAATQSETRSYAAIDGADTQPLRPNFAVLVYPAYLAEKDGGLKSVYPVTKQTPPMFFAQASDDRISTDNCIALYRALRDAGVPSEVHLYAKGGHGFGLRPSTEAPAPGSWPGRCAEWMKGAGLLGPGKP
jgi:acetyl esterase/lipase